MIARRGAAAAVVAVALAALGCAAGSRLAGDASHLSYAERLLARRCDRCHARPDPAAMPREKWLAALERMHRRVRLESADWDSLAALAAAGPGDSAGRR